MVLGSCSLSFANMSSSVAVQDFDNTLARQGNGTPLLQVGEGATYRLDRNREVVSDVVARDG